MVIANRCGLFMENISRYRCRIRDSYVGCLSSSLAIFLSLRCINKNLKMAAAVKKILFYLFFPPFLFVCYFWSLITSSHSVRDQEGYMWLSTGCMLVICLLFARWDHPCLWHIALIFIPVGADRNLVRNEFLNSWYFHEYKCL